MAIGEFQPIDLLGMQGGLGNLPTAANVQALGNQQAAAAAGIEGLQARAMAERAQAQAAQQEQIDAQRFQTDLATFGDGSPKSIVTMMQRNPKYAKLLSDAHALEKADIQEADTLLLNGIYSRASNGDFAGAAAQARRRLEAEKAAGNDTTDEQAMVDQLESGDPALQQRAMRVIGGDLAGRVGLEKFASVYGGVTTTDGNVVNRGTGDVTYQGKPDVRGVVIAGGTDEYGNQQPSRLVNPVTGEPIGGGAPAMGGAAPVAGGAPATGSRAARNNNPGNLEASEWTQRQPGYVGTDGRFAVFDTPANGAAAMTSLLANNYLAKGVNTIGGIISKYAPASDGNNVNAYVGAVSKATGIKPNQPLTPDDLPAVVAAMTQVEGGGSGGAAPAGRERTQKELAFRYGAPPAGQILAQDGTRIRDPLASKATGPLTEAQGKASGYYRTAAAAASTINNLTGYSPSLTSQAIDKGKYTSSELSQTDRRFLNAARAFSNAVLRFESGAAISQGEVDEMARILFPMPGDGPEAIADKNRLRGTKLDALRVAGGPGVDKLPRVTGKEPQVLKYDAQGRRIP